jgi:hypothetical protein
MAQVTNFECDNCGRSIVDPGVKVDLRLENTKIKDGQEYMGPDRFRRELCESCGDRVEAAIERALREGKPNAVR